MTEDEDNMLASDETLPLTLTCNECGETVDAVNGTPEGWRRIVVTVSILKALPIFTFKYMETNTVDAVFCDQCADDHFEEPLYELIGAYSRVV